MKLSETINILYVDVEEWRLVCNCPCPGATEHPTWLLRLSGATSEFFADFTEPLPLELSIFCDDQSQAGEELSPWQLSVIDRLDEYNIPLMLEGGLTVPKAIWSDAKENLLISARKPDYAVRMRLETREFLDRPSPFDPERNFAVIFFSFELHHRKAY